MIDNCPIYGPAGFFLKKRAKSSIYNRLKDKFLIAYRISVLFFKKTDFNDLIYSQSISKEVPFCVNE